MLCLCLLEHKNRLSTTIFIWLALVKGRNYCARVVAAKISDVNSKQTLEASRLRALFL